MDDCYDLRNTHVFRQRTRVFSLVLTCEARHKRTDSCARFGYQSPDTEVLYDSQNHNLTRWTGHVMMVDDGVWLPRVQVWISRQVGFCWCKAPFPIA